MGSPKYGKLSPCQFHNLWQVLEAKEIPSTAQFDSRRAANDCIGLSIEPQQVAKNYTHTGSVSALQYDDDVMRRERVYLCKH